MIIDTPHYNRLLRAELAWVARRNQTWSLHAHVGIRGADRAIAVCDSHARRPAGAARDQRQLTLPRLHDDTGLASCPQRSCSPAPSRAAASHEPFGDWETTPVFVAMLERTSSIVESDAALVERPAPSRLRDRRGADLRRAERAARSRSALAGLMIGLRRAGALGLRRRRARAAAPGRASIEENLWRAIRHGLDGRMIDFEQRRRGRHRRAWSRSSSPGRSPREAGSGSSSRRSTRPARNGAQRARRRSRAGRHRDRRLRAPQSSGRRIRTSPRGKVLA